MRHGPGHDFPDSNRLMHGPSIPEDSLSYPSQDFAITLYFEWLDGLREERLRRADRAAGKLMSRDRCLRTSTLLGTWQAQP